MDDIMLILQQNRLQWYGHVLWKKTMTGWRIHFKSYCHYNTCKLHSWMSMDAVEILPKISTTWVGCTSITDGRQTDERTGDSIYIR